VPGAVHGFHVGNPWNPKNGNLVGPAVRWSPDGTRIAFRLFNDQPGIWVMDLNGRRLVRRIVDLPEDAGSGIGFGPGLDWSPDGTRIAYTYPYYRQRSSLYVVDVRDGGRATSTGREGTRTVAWSPDGSKIAFVRTESDVSSGVFVVNADGTGERRLSVPDLVGQVAAIAWSPDGSSIAFKRDGGPRDPRVQLHVVNADGSSQRDLAPISEDPGCCHLVSVDEVLAWSPDGEHIATIGARDGPPQIVVVAADGSGERVLMPGGYFDWSPDGSQLVVNDAGTLLLGDPPTPSTSYDIYVINADGTGKRWLANGEYPAWSPALGGSAP